MKKQLISLLIAVCLIVGLLPVMAAADAKTASVVIAGVELTVTEGGAAAYTKNAEATYYGEAEASTTFAGWKQVSADSTDWNVKFEYPTGGTPTLTFKGAKVDQYDNENEKWYKFQKDASGCTDKENALILGKTGSQIDLKVVFTDTTSEIENKDFLLNPNEAIGNVEILSENSGSLKAYPGGGFCVRKGFDLVVNADMDINVFLWVQGSINAPLYSDGNIIINGGNLKLTSMGYEDTKNEEGTALKSKSGCYGVITSAGNITINGGKLDLSNRYYSTGGNVGAILCSSETGVMTINGGDIRIHVERMVALYNKSNKNNKGIIINGGNISCTSGWFNLGTHSYLTMNGGTLEMIGEGSYNIDAVEAIDMSALKYYELWTGMAADFAEQATELEKKTYIKIVALDGPPATTAPTTAPTVAPTAAPTTAPTTASEAPTTGPADAQDEGGSPVLPIVIGVVVLAGVAVAVVVILKKKKQQ